MAAGALSSGRDSGAYRGRSSEPELPGAGRDPDAYEPGDIHGKTFANRALRAAGTRRKVEVAAIAPTETTHHITMQDGAAYQGTDPRLYRRTVANCGKRGADFQPRSDGYRAHVFTGDSTRCESAMRTCLN